MNALSPLSKSAAVIMACFISINCFGQEAARLKMQFLPEKQYHIQVVNNVEMQMSSKRDSATGVGNAVSGAEVSKMSSGGAISIQITSSRKIPTATKMPLYIKYDRKQQPVFMNGVEMPDLGKDLVDGAEVKGWSSSKTFIEVDTATKTNLAPQITPGMIADLISEELQYVDFPDKAMQVGDSFERTLNIPLSMPGMENDLEGINVFKLVSLSYDLAVFNLLFKGSMKSESEGYSGATVTTIISGSGMLKFSRKNSFITEISKNIAVDFKTSKASLNFEGGIKVKSVCNVAITAVK